MFVDWGIPTPLLLVVVAIVVAGIVARRVPFLRLAINLVSWLVLGGLLLVVLQQREQFDPNPAGDAGPQSAGPERRR